MLAGADGVGELGEPGAQPAQARLHQRIQGRGPAPGLRIVPLVKLRRELEQPGEAVGALEGRPPFPLHVLHLGREVRRRQALIQGGPRLGGERRVGEAPRQTREQPVPVHGRVPVVAAVEGRGEDARRLHVGVAVERVGDLVRILLVNAGERQVGETLGGGRVEALLLGGGRGGGQRGQGEGDGGPEKQGVGGHGQGWYIHRLQSGHV